ncbi:MAG: glycerophosphodiester phosphodiesterase [Woeseiaceae bacterium]
MSDRSTLVIAHRGACGYLPEHTLEAKAYAHALGADYIEQDIVGTRDDELIVMHDIHLDRVTNVAERFPDRGREDGRFYVRDFDLAEIRTLVAWERRTEDGITAVFPNRFPSGLGAFRVPTLREEIKFIQGLNRSTGRQVGIYPEIKRPQWHRDEGLDISQRVVQLLDDLGYRTKNDSCYLQCFDAAEVRRIRQELGCQLNMVQLIGDNAWGESATDYDELIKPAALQQLAGIVDGIGPSISHLVTLSEIDGSPVSLGLVSAAHAVDLAVHAYTFRADQLAPGFDSLQQMVGWFVDELHLDGVFTDFPDQAIEAIDA